MRVEVPTATTDAVTARLLDRNGKPLAIPVAGAVRDDADGSRWRTAQLSLTPLGPGDYIIEMTAGAGAEQDAAGWSRRRQEVQGSRR